jgi:chorismate dehydratase
MTIVMRPLRISAISYLNTAPLMWDFEHGHTPVLGKTYAGSACEGAQADFEFAYTVPSQCAEQLQNGTADIGIIPSITYASIPSLVIIPNAAIAARDAVRSIVLVCKKPWEEIRSVALDTSSRTSVALTRILLEKFGSGGRRGYLDMQPDLPAMLERCDAGLLIGDPALLCSIRADSGELDNLYVYDLSREWHRFTGLPFVFAFWAVRLAALGEMRRDLDLQEVFNASRDHGTDPANINSIAQQWAPKLTISEAEIERYLTANINYYLDEANFAGLELFYKYAAECGLIEEIPTLRFIGASALKLCS